MDQLVKILNNAGHLLEIMTTARTESVSNWDFEALQRAHDWTKYFEQVYFKIHQKPVFVSKLEKHLKLKYEDKYSLGLGNEDVNFELFRKARRVFLQSLLQNPHLDKSLFGHVIKFYEQLARSGGTPSTSQKEGPGPSLLLDDATKYTQSKATVMLLSKIKDKLSQTCHSSQGGQECGLSASAVYLQTEAELLSQKLCNLLQGNAQKENNPTITGKLEDLYSKKYGLETIALMLVREKEDHGMSAETEQCNQLVLSWLLQKCTESKSFDGSQGDFCDAVWQLPNMLLSQLSAKYFTFFRVYLAHLMNWGKCMQLQYDGSLQRSVWRHSKYPENPHFGWERLAESFSHLTKGPQFLNETVRRVLQSTSQSSDGGGGGEELGMVESGVSALSRSDSLWEDIVFHVEHGSSR